MSNSTTKRASVLDVLAEFRDSLTKSAGLGDAKDGGNQAPVSGDRAADNTKEIKANVPANVDSAPANGSTGVGGINAPTASIGTTASYADQDAQPTKDKKDDPGTSLTGAKAASLTVEDLEKTANNILAELTLEAAAASKQAAAITPVVPAAVTPAAPPVAAPAPAAPATTPEKQASEDTATAAGFAAGQALVNAIQGAESPEAAEKIAAAFINEATNSQAELAAYTEKLAHAVVTQAQADAAAVAAFVAGYNKQAAEAAAATPENPDAAGDAAGAPEGGVDPLTVQVAQALLNGSLTLEELTKELAAGETPGGDAGAPAEAAMAPASVMTGGAAPSTEEKAATVKLAKALETLIRTKLTK